MILQHHLLLYSCFTDKNLASYVVSAVIPNTRSVQRLSNHSMIRANEDFASSNDIDSTSSSTSSSTMEDERAASPSSMSQMVTKQRGGILSIKEADAILDWFIFPALLYIQFGVTLYCQHRQQPYEKQIGLMWIIVIFMTITIFCLIANGYRKFYHHCPTVAQLLLLLLPEIFTNIVLCIVMVAGVFIGLAVLVVFTAILSIMVSIGFYHQQTSGLHSIADPTGYKSLTDLEDSKENDNCNDEEARNSDDRDDDDDDEVWLC